MNGEDPYKAFVVRIAIGACVVICWAALVVVFRWIVRIWG